jgi:hypothetical protein
VDHRKPVGLTLPSVIMTASKFSLQDCSCRTVLEALQEGLKQQLVHGFLLVTGGFIPSAADACFNWHCSIRMNAVQWALFSGISGGDLHRHGVITH